MQFYQLATICFVTSRKKMQSTLICSLDCDANSIFVWVGWSECGLMPPHPNPLPKGERELEHPLSFGERVGVKGKAFTSEIPLTA